MSPQAQTDHNNREAAKVKQADAASDQRMADAQKTLGVPGPKRGGLAEALASPEALQKSREMREAKEAQRQQAKTDLHIKTPARPAQTPENRLHFASGAAEGVVTAKPMVASTNPRFGKKEG